VAYLLGVIESEDRIPDRDDEGMDEDWPGIHGMSRPGMDAHGRDADAAAATPASSGTESAAASLALDAGASLMLDPLRSPSSQPDPACFMYRVDWRDLVGLLHSLIDSTLRSLRLLSLGDRIGYLPPTRYSLSTLSIAVTCN
jgi:hypothetical protein